MTRDSGRSEAEQVTPTGWRVVGVEAQALLDAAEVAPLDAEEADAPLFACSAQVRPLLGAQSAIGQVLAALTSELARHHDGIAPLSQTRAASAPPTKVTGFIWEVEGQPGAWTGELLWRGPHPGDPSRACLSHVILSEQGTQLALALRCATGAQVGKVTRESDTLRLRPGFLAELRKRTRLTFEGLPASPVTVDGDDVPEMVAGLLQSPSRRLPVVVLAPLEAGGYAVPPEELADELCGIAHLRVLREHRDSFRLTDAVGDRRLSAYWGAARAYLPGFVPGADGGAHPLLQHDQVGDPVMRAFLFGRLAAIGVESTRWPRGLLERRASRSQASERPPANDVRPSGSRGAPLECEHDEPSTPSAAALEVRALAQAMATELRQANLTLRELLEANRRLEDELEQLRATFAVRSAGTTGIERRLAALERLLRPADGGISSEAAGAEAAESTRDDDAAGASVSLVDVVRQAGEQHSDALVMLPSAERTASESPYEDPDRVRDILDAMALVARRRQEGKLGKSLKDAFREIGVDYRRGIADSTPQTMREQYRFKLPNRSDVQCEEHIALGNSYDPRHCLRIYFTSRAPAETRFVIGHVGRHLEVLTST